VAHVQKRGRKYIARYVGPDRIERSRSFARKIEAERFVATTEADKLRGSWVDPEAGSRSLAEFWQTWRQRAELLSHPAASTLSKYDGIWKLYVRPRPR
jgi:hypothetical protein